MLLLLAEEEVPFLRDIITFLSPQQTTFCSIFLLQDVKNYSLFFLVILK